MGNNSSQDLTKINFDDKIIIDNLNNCVNLTTLNASYSSIITSHAIYELINLNNYDNSKSIIRRITRNIISIK